MYLIHQARLKDLAAIHGRKMVLPEDPNPEWLLRQSEIARGLAEIRDEARQARAEHRSGFLRTFLRLGLSRE